jgi:hypothetical protein
MLMSYTAGRYLLANYCCHKGRGLTADTEDRLNTFILPGVKTGATNTTQINNSSYYFNNLGFGPSELRVYDGSVIRLQEISLGYDIPKEWLIKLLWSSMSSGYNLYYNAFNTQQELTLIPT